MNIQYPWEYSLMSKLFFTKYPVLAVAGAILIAMTAVTLIAVAGISMYAPANASEITHFIGKTFFSEGVAAALVSRIALLRAPENRTTKGLLVAGIVAITIGIPGFF